MVWPSTHPSSRRPCRNASRWRYLSEEAPPSHKTPMRGTFAGGCARGGSGTARMAKARVSMSPRVVRRMVEFSNIPVRGHCGCARGVHPALPQDTPPPLCGQSVTHHLLHLGRAHAMCGSCEMMRTLPRRDVSMHACVCRADSPGKHCTRQGVCTRAPHGWGARACPPAVRYASASSSAFASCRSAVSKPSVNQP